MGMTTEDPIVTVKFTKSDANLLVATLSGAIDGQYPLANETFARQAIDDIKAAIAKAEPQATAPATPPAEPAVQASAEPPAA
jgi:hypothetical protein